MLRPIFNFKNDVFDGIITELMTSNLFLMELIWNFGSIGLENYAGLRSRVARACNWKIEYAKKQNTITIRGEKN